jgi:hypothetical protein
MGCAGVPESMWSVAGSDHTKLAHALLDHRSKTSVRKSTVRVFQGKEDFTFSALRTNLAEIAQNRLTDLLHRCARGQLMDASRLGDHVRDRCYGIYFLGVAVYAYNL